MFFFGAINVSCDLQEVISEIRSELNPHPAGQKDLNVPKDDKLTGGQQKNAQQSPWFIGS